jgi:hypothetical protein
MTPEEGKWYWICYSKKTSSRHYEGPGLCMGLDAYESSASNMKLWRFVQPDVPDRLRERLFIQELYASRDIKKEISEPEITATKAMSMCYNGRMKEKND